MSRILLSFCIPTYNRSGRIANIINQIIPFKSDEIEIVISDNASPDDTEKVVKSFKDPRIKYFRNKLNLGFDANVLLVIKRATGKFIYLLMDEDDIEMKNIPWILDQIRKNDQLSQLCGSIGDKRLRYNGDYEEDLKVFRNKPRKFEEILYQRYMFNKTYSRSDIRFKFQEQYLKAGANSLKELLFWYPHGSGIILRKNILDFNKAKKSIGLLFIQQVFIAQALIAGDTLSTSKVFAYFGKTQYESRQSEFKGTKWWHPLNRINQTRYRTQIIYDIIKNLKKKKKLKRILLNIQREEIYTPLLMLLFSKNTINFVVLSSDFEFGLIFYNLIPLIKSIKPFMDGLHIVFQMRNPFGILRYLLKKIIKAFSRILK